MASCFQTEIYSLFMTKLIDFICIGFCSLVCLLLLDIWAHLFKISLVNDSLNFETRILQIHCYFLLKTCENPLLFFVEKI